MPARYAPVVVATCSTLVALYAGEHLVERAQGRSYFDRVRAAAQAERRTFDGRTQLDVVRDLRRQGIAAVPFFNVKDIAAMRDRLGDQSDALVPLSGLGGAVTVNCNESGEWTRFTADRHGFNNPDAIWNVVPDVVLLGDSFAMGQCVGPGEDIAGRLRATGTRALTLGYAGKGPVATLATLREYAEPLRPPPPRHRAVFDHFATLGGIRHLARTVVASGADDLEAERALFEDVLAEAVREVRAWGGRLILLHLPSWEYAAGHRRMTDRVAVTLARVSNRHDVPLVSATPLFEVAEPFMYFQQGRLVPTHYSAAGYDAVARLLADAIAGMDTAPAAPR
jgi:hypothetical protein